MDSLQQEEGPVKTPLKGTPSILYFIDNIPENAESLKFEVISHFQKRKRHKGGEVVTKEYHPVGPNSALLLFENAEEVSELQEVSHCIKGEQLELRPLVKELVTLELGGSPFIQDLMSSEQVAKLIKDEELLLTKENNNCTISGNWISVEQFRQNFQQFMITKLQKHPSEVFSTLFDSTSDTTESTVDPKAETTEDAPSGGVISPKGSSLNPDVLALMQKTGAYQHSALSYDLQTATINVDCDDPTEKDKIKEEFYSSYQELMMGGKLKEYAFPVDDVQQANVIVDEYTKMFSHTYFRYDPEKKEIKCLSTDARQMQNVRRRLNSMKKTPKVTSVCIDLPKLSRKVTIKLGDIIEEEVDVIVNAANDRLTHGAGVAAAIDKASYGAIQQQSSKLIEQTGTLPTGGAVITSAGGKLKCNFVVHAVGPIAYQHKDQCGSLLHKACLNSMNTAQRYKAKSISFPPISSGIFGVSKELVANVMLLSLCSYTCSDPELLNDVRIVIIDEPTFDVFIKFFNEEKENLKLLQDSRPTEDSSKTATTSQDGMRAESSPQLGPQKGLSNLVSINLPNPARKVTIKFGDIVQEEVDAMVNSANMYLLHNTGVAAAIDKASGGIVQTESRKITWTRKVVPTGDALATAAGGALKCKHVIHAVGPIADQHKDQCGVLLKKACVSAMNVAQNFEATSIAFPPISSGNSGVSTDLVANIMLSTLCSYTCSNATLLSDVRIVIIDKPTFEVFLNAFHKQQQGLEQVRNKATTTAGFFKPPTFQYGQSAGGHFSSLVPDSGIKVPGHVQPVSYSQAVIQQATHDHGMSYPSITPDAQSTNSSPPTSQYHGQAMPETPGNANSGKKDAKSSPIMSEPNGPNNPGDSQGGTVGNTEFQRVDSSDAANNSTTTDENGTTNLIRSMSNGDTNGDTKGDKHSEDIPIDRYKDNNGENETVSSDFAAPKKPGYDISVDPTSTKSDKKLRSDNGNPSLQPTSTDPLNDDDKHKGISSERNDPSTETSRDSTGSAQKQNSVSMSLFTKHLPPSTEGDRQTSLQNSESKDTSKGKKKGDNEKTEACPICYDELKSKPVTAVATCKNCKQSFCKGCLDEALKHKPYCPTCTVPLRKVTGNQPMGGTMTVNTYPKQKLPGYEQYGTIQINYDIPSGKQGKEHPNPGQYFRGTSRTAYVPNSPEGRKVVQLLRKAFNAQLIFTVGTSHTSGATNAVVWNDIHHKTSISGGPTNYGYPDPTYLSRVLEELAAKGIKE